MTADNICNLVNCKL